MNFQTFYVIDSFPQSAKQPGGKSHGRGLKRTRTKFVSPLLSQKKMKLEPSAAVGGSTPSSATSTSTDTSSSGSDGLRARLDFTDSSQDGRQCSDGVAEGEKVTLSGHFNVEGRAQLVEEERSLVARLKERKEKLRKLKMVKMYRTKNDLKELQRLTSRWREVAQEAAEDLLNSSTHEPRPSMAQVLDYLHIDHELIHYSVQDESFY